MGQLLAASRVARALAFVFALIATAGATAQPETIPVTAFGPDDAPVVLTVFSDFACEPCAHLAVVIQGAIEARPTKVRVLFRHLPAEGGRGTEAHLASLAAAEQGRFFEFHNLAFANQNRLTREDTLSMAAQLGLDVERFARTLADPGLGNVLSRDRNEAEAGGVAATPSVLLNGVEIPAPITLATLLQRIDGSDVAPAR